MVEASFLVGPLSLLCMVSHAEPAKEQVQVGLVQVLGVRQNPPNMDPR